MMWYNLVGCIHSTCVTAVESSLKYNIVLLNLDLFFGF